MTTTGFRSTTVVAGATPVVSIAVAVVVVLAALGCSLQNPEKPESPKAVANAAGQAHGLQAWSEKEVVQADVSVVLGGEQFVDGRFWFEVHGPRARMEGADGRTVVHDGQDAYLLKGGDPEPIDRSHVLAWPFFIRAPLQMSSKGPSLSDQRPVELRGTEYWTVHQTFAEGEGDTPDDWWRYFVHPETHRVEWASYIVTFGKTVEEANEAPRLIDYRDFRTLDGVTLATDYTFYSWDEGDERIAGDMVLGTGTVRNLRFIPAEEVDFRVPEDAVKIPMPSP